MGEQPPPGQVSAVMHQVDDEEVAVAGTGGIPRAQCGQVFRPASMVIPFGRACPACRATEPPRVTG